MTDSAILDHIARLPHARATFKQLVRELGSRIASRQEVEAALDRLTLRMTVRFGVMLAAGIGALAAVLKLA